MMSIDQQVRLGCIRRQDRVMTKRINQSHTMPSRRYLRLTGLFKAFRRRQDGATAIEFGMVALPFFMVLFAIIETAMIFFTSQVLETAVANASRVIRTGQAVAKYPNPATALANFKNDVCANVTKLVDCQGALQIDVKSFTSFAAADAAATTSGGNLDTSAFGYQVPGPSQIFVIRAVLAYPLYVPTWNHGLATLNGNKRAIVASAAFRTEPF
jgi:Flp pilus assembly protein TadG